MTLGNSVPPAARASWGMLGAADAALRRLVVAAGLGWSALFVAIGLACELQLYGDGSLFSYSVAVREGWAFHWHNIPGRAFVYLFCYVPAEAFAALTGSARGGIAVYALLFFAAPLLGLLATWVADRSKGRVLFVWACASTAGLCPLVFGFPTEMWMAHALFWPALALCHHADGGIRGPAAVFAALLALAFTHEGALILALAIVASLLLRGARDAARAAAAFLAVVAIWMWVKAAFPPDAYDAPILARAAQHFFDPAIFTGAMPLLLSGALAGYGIAWLALRRAGAANPEAYAAALTAAALAVYWLGFDRALHADNRYYLRTVLLIATAGLGALAVSALAADGRKLPAALRRLLPALKSGAMRSGATRAAAGAFALVMLVHAVETAKFLHAWSGYKDAVRALALGPESDPSLGDARFVSAGRIAPALNRLSWNSTTPYLSVLLAPGFSPARLVVDPTANYVWLSCAAARANEDAERAIPLASRRLVRLHACLHR